ncbi:MAG: radical SAM protein [bacterium]
MNEKPRVLLTANYGPNELIHGKDMTDLMNTRWMRGHGPFEMNMYGHYFALYLIAENISNPSTVLENPEWEEFDRELDEGYDYVCFQLKSVHTDKIARMIKRIREKSPGTKVVVGGYGVGTLGSPVPGDVNGDAAYIREESDYLCRGEGVRFMRELLEDEPVDREITQYDVPTFALGGFFGKAGVHLRIPTILVSLGCPNGCDFCNTSAMFNHRKIRVAEPEQVYRYIKNYQKRLNFQQIIVMLWDEDFFQDPEYVRELGRLLREDRKTWGVKYYTFGSIQSLSQFSAEEIRDCGCQMIWIGVESFQSGPDQTVDHYQKRGGKEVKQIFDDLQKHGVQPTGSLVLGLDFHTRENLKDDIDRFVDLKPMFYQVSHVLPCPGTALYDRMIEENTINDDYKWKDLHFWSSHLIKYKHLDKAEADEMFKYAHDQLRDVNGPPTLQMMESLLDSYQRLKDKPDKFHRAQAKRDQLIAFGFSAFLESIKEHHPSQAVRERARMLSERCEREIGEPKELKKDMVKAIGRYISRNMGDKINSWPEPLTSDPPTRWSYYHTFDDRVWVKKGSQDKDPEPYQDGWFVAGEKLSEVIEEVKAELSKKPAHEEELTQEETSCR